MDRKRRDQIEHVPFFKVGALKVDERTYARYMSDVAYFLSKLEAEPDSYYFIPIALAYNKLEKYDETISVCRAGLERFPTHCQAKVLLAEAYVYKGDTDRARDILFDVLTEDEDNYKALKLLGIIYQALEMPDEAVKYFRGAYLRSPEDTELKRTVEDMGGSVDIDDVIKNSAASGEAAGEDDEDSRTFFEIEQKIKNAELVMADLVADKSIMGPKRGDEDSAPAPAMAGDSNLISDDELEKLISMANSPEIAPMKQEEIAPPDSSAIDDDLARLMEAEKTGRNDNAGSVPAADIPGDGNLINDDELEKLISMANSPEAAPMKQEEIAPPDSSAIDGGFAGLTGLDETAGGDNADSEHAPEYGEQAVLTDTAPVLEEPGGLYMDGGFQPGSGEPEGGEDGLLAALNAAGGADDPDGLISALAGNGEDDSAENDLISALGGEAESGGDDLLAALSGQDGLAEHMEEAEPADALSDEAGVLDGGLPDFPFGNASETDNKDADILDGKLPAADDPAPALADRKRAGTDNPAPALDEGLSDIEGLAEHMEEAEPADALSDEAGVLDGGLPDFPSGNVSETNNKDADILNGELPAADFMIPDDDFDFDDDDGYVIPQYAGLSAPEEEAAAGPDTDRRVEMDGGESAPAPVDLGDSAPFVQSDIWDEILEASGMEDGSGMTGPDEEKEKAVRERQLKKLEERLEKLRKRTEK